MKNKRKFIIGLILIVLFVMQIIILTNVYSDTRETVVITFADSNMAKAVYRTLTSENCTGYTEYTVTIYKDVLESRTTLTLNDNEITDISGIENFTGLTDLDLSKNSISDISSIQYLTKLKVLNLSENGNISDISYLANNTLLEELNLNNNIISDLSGISKLYKLTSLDISYNQISLLSDISGLINLVKLSANNNQIDSIEDILSLTNLIELNLNGNSISDITDISNLRNLETLNIGNNKVTNLSPLIVTVKAKAIVDEETEEIISVVAEYDSSTKTWIYLDEYSEEADKAGEYTTISSLLKLRFLTSLNIESNGITSIASGTFAKWTGVKKLYAQGNSISSIKGISSMTALETLYLDYNNIADISPLFDLEESDVSSDVKLKKLVSVSAAYQTSGITTIYTNKSVSSGDDTVTRKVSFADFANLRMLNLAGNKIYDISTIAYKDFDSIDLSYQSISVSVNKRDADDDIQEIILPNIFIYTLYSSSNVTTNKDFTYVNCGRERTDGKTETAHVVFIDTYDLSTNKITATVKIVGGNANGTVITYSAVNSGGLESIVFEDSNMYRATLDTLLSLDSQGKFTYGYVTMSSPYNLINIYETDLKKVTSLSGSSYGIKDVTGIKRLKYLTTLDLSQNSISNFGEMAKLPSLATLKVNNNQIQNISESLAFSSTITTINASENQITDIAGLSSCTKKLTELNLYNNQITDITPLTSLTKLTTLNLGVNNISDLSTISNLTALTSLVLSNNDIEDSQLEKLVVLESLKNLELSDNGLKDVGKINEITSLRTLTLTSNNIEDLNLISGLNQLSTLNINGNKISDLSGIENLTQLSSLDLSNNKISDVTKLGYLKNLVTLKLDYNKISEIDTLETMMTANLDSLSLKYQTIAIELTQEQAESYETLEFNLPSIFQKSLISSNIVYSETGLSSTNCTLSNNIVQVSGLWDDVAFVTINDGIAKNSALVIEEELRADITYSTEESTNQDVIAEITFNKATVTITNNGGNNTYTFADNGTFTFEFEDSYGVDGTATATVNWIDKEEPILTVSYEETEIDGESVIIATINSSEEIQEVDDWELSENKLTLTKTYTETAEEEVTVYDLAGNKSTITVYVTIGTQDTEAPKLNVSYSSTGTTTESVIVTITSNEKIQGINGWTLSSDGLTLTKTYTENKTENITVYDLAGNGTSVIISVSNIEEELVIESEVYEISDINAPDYITNVSAKTKLSEFINNITTNATKVVVKSEAGATVSSTSYIATGMTIEFNETVKYTIVVEGDANGDGQVKASDISKIKTHVITSVTSKKLTGAYLEAADVNKDGQVRASDVSQIIKMTLGM